MHTNFKNISSQGRIQGLENKVKTLEKSLLDREIESAMMIEVAEAVNSGLSLQKIMDLTAHHAQKLIQSESLLIPVLDENCETYTYKAGCGENAEEIIGESLPLDFGVCGWVWKNKRPWWKGVLDELEENERNLWEKEAGSIIMVPLEGKIISWVGYQVLIKSVGVNLIKETWIYWYCLHINRLSLLKMHNYSSI